MHHYQVEVGQRVTCNSPEAGIGGTVTDAMDRKHTKIGSMRYRYRVQWDTGAVEWLGAGEIKPWQE